MLKKFSIRKIIVASLALIMLVILYLIPGNEEKELELKHDNIEYVYPNNLAVIYLLDSNDYVARTLITSCNCSEVDKAMDLLEGLTIDGKKSNIIPNGFRSIIPSGTSVKNIELDKGVLTIDFSRELLEINSDYEEKMIESIIYTLTNIEGIDKVIIKVDGSVLERLPNSNKLLPEILDRSFGINKDYDINNIYFLTYKMNNVKINDNSFLSDYIDYLRKDSNMDKSDYRNGYRIIVNCGKDAGQEVMHLHYHILAGEKFGDKIV